MSQENNATPEQDAGQQTIVNPDGTFSENWAEKYGQDHQPHLSRYKDLDSLVKSHINTKSKLGKDPERLVEIPDENSPEEVKQAWRKAHGVPESKDEYKYEMPDEMAIKIGPVDEKKMDAFKDFADKKGWSKQDFSDALDFYYNTVLMDVGTAEQTLNEQRQKAKEEAEALLKKEWRDGYDDRVARAQSVMEKFGGIDAVERANLQNSPEMIKFLDNIAEAMSEDTLKGTKADIAPTSSNIKSQINDIRQEMNRIQKENPVNYKANLKYKELMDRKHELYKMMPA